MPDNQRPLFSALFDLAVSGDARPAHERRVAGERLHLTTVECWIVAIASVVFAGILAKFLMDGVPEDTLAHAVLTIVWITAVVIFAGRLRNWLLKRNPVINR